MWSFKTINIFICVCCITSIRAEVICDQQYELPNWEPDGSKRPGFLRLGLVAEVEAALKAQIENVRENFTLNLYANPFIRNASNKIKEEKGCPSAVTSYHDLRKFHKSTYVIKGRTKLESIYFGNIFTGCYYVEMTNAEGKKWLWNPRFFNTSYHYYDTMLKCKKFNVQPQDYELSRQLTVKLEIPLNCMQVRCLLFELDEVTNNTKHDLDVGRIPATQNCTITNEGIGTVPHVECWRTDARPRLYATDAVKRGEGWGTSITWDFLKDGGASYFTLFEQYNHTCDINYVDLMTWEPVIKFGALIHGFRNESNAVPEPEQTIFSNISTASLVYILLSIGVTAILVYWILKSAKILINRKRSGHNLAEKTPGILQLYDKIECNHILLIYARDSPEFMAIMDSLRKRLQQVCHCPVHDLYSIDEWNSISKLGAAGWVEDLLRAGSKVVWVDTPKFRSILRESKLDQDEERQHIALDFRDEALPYAVSLATDLFQNVTTQYRCHFVVRVEGYEVGDGNDDALLVVSPHARYCIPEHLSFLFENLAR